MRWLRFLWRSMRMNLRTPDDDWSTLMSDDSPLEARGVDIAITVWCIECDAYVSGWLRTATEFGELVQCSVRSDHWWIRHVADE